jgi:hypothetical protein
MSDLSQKDINILYPVIKQSVTETFQYHGKDTIGEIYGMIFTKMRSHLHGTSLRTLVSCKKKRAWYSARFKTTRSLIEMAIRDYEESVKEDELMQLRLSLAEMNTSVKKMETVNESGERALKQVEEINQILSGEQNV